jgi:hypothetical protein
VAATGDGFALAACATVGAWFAYAIDEQAVQEKINATILKILDCMAGPLPK